MGISPRGKGKGSGKKAVQSRGKGKQSGGDKAEFVRVGAAWDNSTDDKTIISIQMNYDPEKMDPQYPTLDEAQMENMINKMFASDDTLSCVLFDNNYKEDGSNHPDFYLLVDKNSL